MDTYKFAELLKEELVVDIGATEIPETPSLGLFSTNSPFQTSLADFIIMRNVGEGKLSTMFEAERIKDGKVYIIKSFHNKDNPNWDWPLNEVRMIASLDHPFISTFKEAFFESFDQHS